MAFDPYHKWLGIPREDQPPNHYRLLGLNAFESDPDVIEVAANRQMVYLKQCADGPEVALSQTLLNEIAAARLCLLKPDSKSAYDAELKQKLTEKLQSSRRDIGPSASTRPRRRTRGFLIATIAIVAALTLAWFREWSPNPPAKSVSRGGAVDETARRTTRKGKKSVPAQSVATAAKKEAPKEIQALKSPSDQGGAIVSAASEPSESDTSTSADEPADPDGTADAPESMSAPDVSVAGTGADASSSESEQWKPLQGKWVTTREEINGEVFSTDKVKQTNRRIEFRENSLRMTRRINGAPGEYSGRFQIDPQSGTFDWSGTGPKGLDVQWTGIYEVNGEVLKLAYRYVKGETARPKSFKTISPGPAEGAFIYLVLKRIKVEQSAGAASVARKRPIHVPADAVSWKGRWYWFPDSKVSFDEALAEALKKKGRLISIESIEENEFIASQVRGATFIGILKSQGRWFNDIGTQQQYFNWDRGQPSSIPNENWAAINKNGKWHDYLPDRLYYAVEWGKK